MLPPCPASPPAWRPLHPSTLRSPRQSQGQRQWMKHGGGLTQRQQTCGTVRLPACLPGLPSCRDQPGQSQTQPSPCRSKAVLSFVGCQVTESSSQVTFRGKIKILPGCTGPLDPQPSCFISPLPRSVFKQLSIWVTCF